MCHLPISGVLPPNLDLSPVTHLSSFKKPNIVKKNIPEQACNPQSWTSQNCGFPTKWKIYDETFPAYRYDCLERELSIQEWSCLHLQKVGKKKWQKLCIDNLKYQVFFQFTTSLELDLDEIVQNLCEANIEKPFVPLLLCFHCVGTFGQIWLHSEHQSRVSGSFCGTNFWDDLVLLHTSLYIATI